MEVKKNVCVCLYICIRYKETFSYKLREIKLKIGNRITPSSEFNKGIKRYERLEYKI